MGSTEDKSAARSMRLAVLAGAAVAAAGVAISLVGGLFGDRRMRRSR
jgi:hypothetical protein